MYDLFPVCLELCDVSDVLMNRARHLSFRGHTSIVDEVFRHFSQCSALFAKIYNYTTSAFLCFFDCFLDAKDQVRTAVESSGSASPLRGSTHETCLAARNKVDTGKVIPGANIGAKNIGAITLVMDAQSQSDVWV